MVRPMAADHVAPAMGMLIEYLRQRERAGQTHVWISGPARNHLREWHQSLRGARSVGRGNAALADQESAGRPIRPVAAVTSSPPPAMEWVPGKADEATVAALAAVRDEVAACPVFAALRARGALRDTMVFAVGNPASPLVFIGEAPGAEEEKLGEPFVGPAGQLLTKMITAMGLPRPDVYITNIVKYRPAIDGGDQGSKNRRPTSEEIAAGMPHLRRELAVLRPRVLVALGATALEGLAGEAIPIGRARGQWREFDGLPVMPTYHPSYLLHNESLAERRKVWEDLLQVMEKLGLPISAKQRSFFKA